MCNLIIYIETIFVEDDAACVYIQVYIQQQQKNKEIINYEVIQIFQNAISSTSHYYST